MLRIVFRFGYLVLPKAFQEIASRLLGFFHFRQFTKASFRHFLKRKTPHFRERLCIEVPSGFEPL